MNPKNLSRRYVLLQAEIKSLMSSSEKWRALPAMLDQLHLLRTQYLAAHRSLECLTEDGERLAFRRVLH